MTDHSGTSGAGTSGARRRSARRAIAATAVALVLGGCSSADDAASTTTAPTTTDAPAAKETTAAPAATSMRGERYCEVLLVRPADGAATADVYNSYPLNDCPQELWAELDAPAIAAAEGVPIAVLNGPRHWLMDSVEKQGAVADLPKKDFGGIEMYRQASVEIGSLADAATPYVPHAVDRDTVFTFDDGRIVYELTAPDGSTYVMQTWSQQKDPSLEEADLGGLGEVLALPDGWSYLPRTLDAPLRIVTTDVPAQVLQDDLGNSYSLTTG
jgi:hypothetical protein